MITLSTRTPPTVIQDADEQRSDLLSDLRALTAGTGMPQAAAVVSRPALLRRLAGALADGIPAGTDRLVSASGPEAALATAVSLHTGIPTATVVADEQGTSVEGELHPSEHVVLIEYSEGVDNTLRDALASSGVTTDAVRRVFGSAQPASQSNRDALFEVVEPAPTQQGEQP